jgi:hypothetical protein
MVIPPTLLARADEVIEWIDHFRCWHFSDMPARLAGVRCRGKSGRRSKVTALQLLTQRPHSAAVTLGRHGRIVWRITIRSEGRRQPAAIMLESTKLLDDAKGSVDGVRAICHQLCIRASESLARHCLWILPRQQIEGRL